jgi:hypothetical protein
MIVLAGKVENFHWIAQSDIQVYGSLTVRAAARVIG